MSSEVKKVDDLTYLMDRYLEVANGYHHHNELRNPRHASREKLTSRQERLRERIAELDLEPKPGMESVKAMAPGEEGSQSVVATKEGLAATKRHQEIVASRMRDYEKMPGDLPEGAKDIVKLLSLPPEEFLAHFDSVTLAWDTLVELAGLAVLPNAETIQAREMLFIQTADLDAHLHEMLAVTLLSNTEINPRVRVSLIESVGALQYKETTGELAAWMLRKSLPQDPGAMLEQLCSYIKPHLPEPLMKDFVEECEERTKDLERMHDGFSDIFQTSTKIKQAIQETERIVSFGLRAGYAMWFAASKDDEASRDTLRKNMLFSTRILLDEARWSIVDDVATFAIGLTRIDNAEFKRDDQNRGIPMLVANRFWARKKSGRPIEAEVRDWETEHLHLRYQFLKNVLLKDTTLAAQQARELLRQDDSGLSNISMPEMEQWPILSEFSQTPEFATLREELQSA